MIDLNAFVPLYTLCKRFYTLFSVKLTLIIAHQGRTAEADGERTWNKITMYHRDLAMHFCSYAPSELAYTCWNVLLTAYPGKIAKRDSDFKSEPGGKMTWNKISCPQRQNTTTALQRDLKED